ncbi:hypothetical protein, conserved [Babesia bigemina]|uniref:Uncharacterized protein n=1 Tax=Babesia bigemina TaxID=5866 RepID=A0A061BJT1_BABBI|nr:hypothetical protein, conserved [Babesia bigemina]CDR71722.1 hypothetical protein, conserved [Babesia bigemina]|eukprot:XP_012770668.1 hypothetical protein, conserved [Babesia bigemina]
MRRVRASVVSRAAWVSVAWAGGTQGLRGLGAAVVVLQLVEGTGSGSGTCCSRLRGLGAAVGEGTGSGSSMCCSWVRGLGAAVVEGSGRGRWEGRRTCQVMRVLGVVMDVEDMNCYECLPIVWKRTNGREPYDCKPSPCSVKCKGKEKTCQCECNSCKKKRESEQRTVSFQSLTLQQQSAASPDTQDHAVTQDRGSHTEAQTQNHYSPESSTGPSISPSAITAVIVAIIVAIILLDLCIFRFPVGRNIRDFLVRKIPFCIAFHS